MSQNRDGEFRACVGDGILVRVQRELTCQNLSPFYHAILAWLVFSTNHLLMGQPVFDDGAEHVLSGAIELNHANSEYLSISNGTRLLFNGDLHSQGDPEAQVGPFVYWVARITNSTFVMNAGRVRSDQFGVHVSHGIVAQGSTIEIEDGRFDTATCFDSRTSTIAISGGDLNCRHPQAPTSFIKGSSTNVTISGGDISVGAT